MYITMNQCIHLNGAQPFKGVLHIGACDGGEIKAYKEAGVETVAWFEANPKMMQELHDKTQKFDDVKQYYFNLCLSDVEGEKIKFNVANNSHSSSMLKFGTHSKMYPHIKYTSQLEMETNRLDEVAKRHPDILKPNLYDFINIDVQGAELKVLKGFGELLRNASFRAIYTEVNFEHVYEDCCLINEIDAYVGQFGFTRVLAAAPERTWGDALYIRIPK